MASLNRDTIKKSRWQIIFLRYDVILLRVTRMRKNITHFQFKVTDIITIQLFGTTKLTLYSLNKFIITLLVKHVCRNKFPSKLNKKRNT